MKSLYRSILDNDDQIEKNINNQEKMFYYDFVKYFHEIVGEVDRISHDSNSTLGNMKLDHIQRFDNIRNNDFVDRIKKMNKKLSEKYSNLGKLRFWIKQISDYKLKNPDGIDTHIYEFFYHWDLEYDPIITWSIAINVKGNKIQKLILGRLDHDKHNENNMIMHNNL